MHALQVKCHACVGGTSVREDTRILQAGVHVVVGTPGRVYDMLRRRALRADRCAAIPLSRVRRMLAAGPVAGVLGTLSIDACHSDHTGRGQILDYV